MQQLLETKVRSLTQQNSELKSEIHNIMAKIQQVDKFGSGKFTNVDGNTRLGIISCGWAIINQIQDLKGVGLNICVATCIVK